MMSVLADIVLLIIYASLAVSAIVVALALVYARRNRNRRDG